MFTRWNPFILCLIKKNTTKNFRKIENWKLRTQNGCRNSLWKCAFYTHRNLENLKIWKYSILTRSKHKLNDVECCCCQMCVHMSDYRFSTKRTKRKFGRKKTRAFQKKWNETEWQLSFYVKARMSREFQSIFFILVFFCFICCLKEEMNLWSLLKQPYVLSSFLRRTFLFSSQFSHIKM